VRRSERSEKSERSENTVRSESSKRGSATLWLWSPERTLPQSFCTWRSIQSLRVAWSSRNTCASHGADGTKPAYPSRSCVEKKKSETWKVDTH
jgi:hypothetical protein